MGKQDSKYDHLRPRLDPTQFRPYFEDRVLVKRLPQPTTEGSLHLPETRNQIGKGDYDPQGLQYGLVVALGPGASGIWKDGEVRMMRSAAPREAPMGLKPDTNRYEGPAAEAVQMPGHVMPWKDAVDILDVTPVVPFECKVGDKVLYSRVPPHEFIHEGETYSFIFEEQSVLAVLELTQEEIDADLDRLFGPSMTARIVA